MSADIPELVLEAPSPIPDPFTDHAPYEGLVTRRVLGFLVDWVVLGLVVFAFYLIFAVAGFLTFGLLWAFIPLIAPLVPVAYHSLQEAGPYEGTLGMRLMGLHVLTMEGGRQPLSIAVVRVFVFYVLLGLTGGLVLFFVFFNPQRRGLHDIIASTVVLRRPPKATRSQAFRKNLSVK